MLAPLKRGGCSYCSIGEISAAIKVLTDGDSQDLTRVCNVLCGLFCEMLRLSSREGVYLLLSSGLAGTFLLEERWSESN